METLKINLPDSWREVSIGSYQEIVALEGATVIDIISILSDNDPEVIRMMDITSLNKIIDHLAWSNTIPDGVYRPIIQIDGQEYGAIPRLSDLTVGEWLDLEGYLTDTNVNMHKIFAILYRPLIVAYNDKDRLIEEYNTESLNRRAELFKEKALIGDVYGYLLFFSLIVKNSTKTIQDFFQEEIKKMKSEQTI
jgi:hypothetical protein